MKRILIVSFLMSICVNAFAAEEKKVVELQPIVITPWRSEEQFSDVSRNVTVITAEDIKRSQAQSLPELIQGKSGIVVSEYLGNPKGSVVDIRGFGETSLSNVLVLVDGRRTNQVDLSGVDWGQIDLSAVEQVEIVKGPSSVLYGDNASGGVVNIITKKGKTDKPKAVVSGALGSYQYHKEYANVSGIWQIGDNTTEILHPATKGGGTQDQEKYAELLPKEHIFLDYFVSFSNQSTTGYRANNDYWADDYFSSVTVRPMEEFELDLSAGYHRDHYGMPGALYWNGNPWVLDPRGINQIGRRGSVFPEDNGFTSDYFITGEPKYNFFLAGNDITISIFNSFRERRAKGLNVPEPNAWGPRSEYETAHHINTYELRPKVETSILWKGIDNKFIFGADYFNAKDDVLSGNRVGQQQDETDVYKETLGFYAHDNIKISDRLLLNAGARTELADYTFNQKSIMPNHESKDLRAEAFNLGGGYKYNENSQFYADISKSFRLPNTEEYYQNKFLNAWAWPPVVQGGLNTAITPQKAINYEIGIKDLTFDWLSVNLDAFLMDVEKEIYYDPTNMQNQNYDDETRHEGIELEARLNLFEKRLKPFGSWVMQKSYFRGGPYDSNVIPFVPKNKISAGLTLSPMEGLDWTTGANYVSSRYMISDQKNLAPKLKDYATVDTKLDYKYKAVSVWGAVKNIFAEEYFAYGVTNATGTAETFYPAPERSFEAGVTIEI